MKLLYKGIEYISGDRVICQIDGIDMGVAHIYINDDGRYFICHDVSSKAGKVSPNLLGHSCSWTFQHEGSGFSEGVKIIGKYYEHIKIKEDVYIENNLELFLQSCGDYDIVHSFKYDTGYLSEFNKYEMSDKHGFLKLSSTKSTKHIEVKFGRLVRTMLENFKKTINNETIIENTFIEKIHNRFVSAQTEGIITYETLRGDDLLKGYKTDSYIETSSSLGNSCMNNKDSYLNIYTKNPNNIELLVLYMFGKVAGRCIVWTDNNGKKYHDRIYYTRDWVNESMNKKCKELGYTYVSGCGRIAIKLDQWNFNEYPYLDSLFYLDTVNGVICNTINGEKVRSNFITMRNTNGTFSKMS